MSINRETDLAPQMVAVLTMALHSLKQPKPRPKLEIRDLVRYVAGALSAEESGTVEIALAADLSQGALLAKTFRTIENFRQMTWTDLTGYESSDLVLTQIKEDWIKCVADGMLPDELPQITLSRLSELVKSSADTARRAMGIVASILDEAFAAKEFAFGAATRAGKDAPIVEGESIIETATTFQAEITNEGALMIAMVFLEEIQLPDPSLWIGFEINRQWLRLGSADIIENKAWLHLTGFGRLLGLTPGPLPPDIFALRIGQWPSVCEQGAFVVQTGSQPFAEVEADPVVESGNVSVDIRLLPHNPELEMAKELELWFGTGSHVWQLLGRWPLPPSRDSRMTLKCPSPKPGQVGIAFPGVLKLALRP